jgi:NADPH2:quinone reductase
MRALRCTSLDGPDAVELADVPEPEGDGVVIDVHAAGVSFPDLLVTRGEYQARMEPPFVPGSEVAGTVVQGEGFAPGDRVAALTFAGGFAERAIAPPPFTFALPGALSFAEGAALVMNYHTAYFCLVVRGRLRMGETVLVHGAAGGVGTATLQVAKALGARTIGVVSSDEKERVARDAGADEVLRRDGEWPRQVADVVIDPVGGERFVDSLRALAAGGRLVVVGFTGGAIPEVKVNRLLLNNTEIVGATWGAYAAAHPDVEREIGEQVNLMAEAGDVKPIIGARLPLERGADALRLLADRAALGKVVLDVRR